MKRGDACRTRAKRCNCCFVPSDGGQKRSLLAENLNEIAINVADAERAYAQVVQLRDVEVDLDSVALERLKHLVEFIDRETGLENSVHFERVFDARNRLRQGLGFGVFDELENVVVKSQ